MQSIQQAFLGSVQKQVNKKKAEPVTKVLTNFFNDMIKEETAKVKQERREQETVGSLYDFLDEGRFKKKFERAEARRVLDGNAKDTKSKTIKKKKFIDPLDRKFKYITTNLVVNKLKRDLSSRGSAIPDTAAMYEDQTLSNDPTKILVYDPDDKNKSKAVKLISQQIFGDIFSFFARNAEEEEALEAQKLNRIKLYSDSSVKEMEEFNTNMYLYMKKSIEKNKQTLLKNSLSAPILDRALVGLDKQHQAYVNASANKKKGFLPLMQTQTQRKETMMGPDKKQEKTMISINLKRASMVKSMTKTPKREKLSSLHLMPFPQQHFDALPELEKKSSGAKSPLIEGSDVSEKDSYFNLAKQSSGNTIITEFSLQKFDENLDAIQIEEAHSKQVAEYIDYIKARSILVEQALNKLRDHQADVDKDIVSILSQLKKSPELKSSTSTYDIKPNKKITKVSILIERAGLRAVSLTYLAKNFTNFRTLKSISLEGNKVKDISLSFFMKVVIQFSESLKRLNLTDTQLGKETINCIKLYLQNPKCTLQVLKLGKNSLDDTSLCEVCIGLSTNNSLRIFDFSYNNITKMSTQIMSSILRYSKVLEAIDFSFNEQLGTEGFYNICKNIGRNTQLKMLNVANTNITDEGVRSFYHCMNTNEALISINLSGNPITNRGCKGLGLILEKNKTLSHIGLQNTGIDYTGVKILKSSNTKIPVQIISGEELDYNLLGLPYKY